MGKPNILLIMCDQLRWDALSCTGDWVKTPNIDRIAAEGIMFTNAVTTSPVCIPARRSLACGKYCHETGIWDNCNTTMPADTPTWMQAVRDAGYRTCLIGKTHLHPHHGDLRDREDLMHAYGLDDIDEIGGPRASCRVLSHMTEDWEKKGIWQDYKDDYDERFSNKGHVARPSVLPLADYADTYVGQQTVNYLKNYDRDQPWFVWSSFGGPHEPWDAPEPYASMYNPADMPPAIQRTGETYKGALQGLINNYHIQSDADIAEMRANYAGNVTLIDDQVGEILQTIESRGELDNTVIVFTSDHGEMNGDHALIHKNQFLNGAVRIPLILRTPETISHAAQSDCPTEWIDIGPTLAEIAGKELEFDQQGISLTPYISNPAYEHRQEAISEISHEVMYLDRKWKGAINADGDLYLLFDQEKDPEEIHNLAYDPDHIEIREKILEVLQRRLKS